MRTLDILAKECSQCEELFFTLNVHRCFCDDCKELVRRLQTERGFILPELELSMETNN